MLRIVLSFILGPQLTDEQAVDCTSVILPPPQIQNNLTTFSMSYSNMWGSKTVDVTIIGTDLSYGQKIHITGNVKEKVLNTNQLIYSIYFPKIQTVFAEVPIINMSLSLFEAIREDIQTIYARSMGKDEASWLLGIVLGVKGNLSKDLLTAFKTTGVMHVIAASGMNLTLVGEFLVSILGRYFKRQYVGLVTLVVLVVYCLLAGFQPSIVRATIMEVWVWLGSYTVGNILVFMDYF